MFPEQTRLLTGGDLSSRLKAKTNKQQLLKNYIFFKKLSVFLLLWNTWNYYLLRIFLHRRCLLLPKRMSPALESRSHQDPQPCPWDHTEKVNQAEMLLGVCYLVEEALVWFRRIPRNAAEFRGKATWNYVTDYLLHHQTWPLWYMSILWDIVAWFFAIKWKHLMKEYFRCICFFHQEGGDRTGIQLWLFLRPYIHRQRHS